jgi:hypothetical protein
MSMSNAKYKSTPPTYTDGDFVDVLTDSAGRQVVSLPASSGGVVSSLGQGKKTVTTAGTPVALAATTSIAWVTIEALQANTGRIAVGGSGVDATLTTGTGATLGSGDAATIRVSDLASVFIDSTVSGEGVRFTYGA